MKARGWNALRAAESNDAMLNGPTRFAGAAAWMLGLGVIMPIAGATLAGTVTNGTTGKAAAGDEVVILSRANGVTVPRRGKTNGLGRFSIDVDDARVSHLVRVIHQGVVYQKMAAPGMTAVNVRVYDAARELDSVTATDVHRFQTNGDTLQAVEEIAVSNASNPPRTLMNGRALMVQLPPEAKVVGGKVQFGEGRPLDRKPSPGDRKGQYYFPFPLYPGDTRFAVAYLLPYPGEAVIEPRVPYPLTEFRAVLPKSMKFEAKTAGTFQPVSEQTETDSQVIGAMNPALPLVFRISGRGTVIAAQGGDPGTEPAAAARSGGGKGTPDGPLDSLYQVMLGGSVLILAAIGLGVARARVRKVKEKQL